MQLIHFKEIDSTNKYLKENYINLDDFTFVSSENQTNGRGRYDRKWMSNKGENLLFSFLIKNKKCLSIFPLISIGTACVISKFLENTGLKNVMIKWPNDIYVNDKKICGILLEGNINEYFVVGCGLNVNQIEFNGEYRIAPTSIRNELKKSLVISDIETNLFNYIHKEITKDDFKNNCFNYLNTHNYLKNKKVTINGVTGFVTGFDDEFNILVDGNKISSGELNILE